MTIEEVEKYVFPYDGFYEVLLSSSGKTDNISPMGVLRKGGALYLRVYSETTTFQNLLVYPFWRYPHNSRCRNVLQVPYGRS
jgi:Uncharacterized conserved protein